MIIKNVMVLDEGKEEHEIGCSKNIDIEKISTDLYRASDSFTSHGH